MTSQRSQDAIITAKTTLCAREKSLRNRGLQRQRPPPWQTTAKINTDTGMRCGEDALKRAPRCPAHGDNGRRGGVG